MTSTKTLLSVVAGGIALAALMMGSTGVVVLLVALAALAALRHAGRDRPIATGEPSGARPWYVWVAAAVALFTIGILAALVLGDGKTAAGEDDTSLLNGLAWITMMLSWFTGAITFVVGIGLGAKRMIDRRAVARTPIP